MALLLPLPLLSPLLLLWGLLGSFSQLQKLVLVVIVLVPVPAQHHDRGSLEITKRVAARAAGAVGSGLGVAGLGGAPSAKPVVLRHESLKREPTRG